MHNSADQHELEVKKESAEEQDDQQERPYWRP